MTIGFGSAKRSYVMCPYTLVKDNDSGYESSNVNAILDGEITLLDESDISMRFDSSSGKVYRYITILDGYEIRYNYKIN